MDLADRAVDPPLRAHVAPMQNEALDRGGKLFGLFRCFCHDRNIGKDRSVVKRALACLMTLLMEGERERLNLTRLAGPAGRSGAGRCRGRRARPWRARSPGRASSPAA